MTDDTGTLMTDVSDTPFPAAFTSGTYTIHASLHNPFTQWRYTYDPDFSGYIISVLSPEMAMTVSDLANEMDIDHPVPLPVNMTHPAPEFSARHSVREMGILGKSL